MGLKASPVLWFGLRNPPMPSRTTCRLIFSFDLFFLIPGESLPETDRTLLDLVGRAGVVFSKDYFYLVYVSKWTILWIFLPIFFLMFRDYDLTCLWHSNYPELGVVRDTEVKGLLIMASDFSNGGELKDAFCGVVESGKLLIKGGKKNKKPLK